MVFNAIDSVLFLPFCQSYLEVDLSEGLSQGEVAHPPRYFSSCGS